MVTLELKRGEFYALFSLAQDRYLESQKPDFRGTGEWVDVATDETVTLEDLVALLSRHI